jgi:hypothetical protein
VRTHSLLHHNRVSRAVWGRIPFPFARAASGTHADEYDEDGHIADMSESRSSTPWWFGPTTPLNTPAPDAQGSRYLLGGTVRGRHHPPPTANGTTSMRRRFVCALCSCICIYSIIKQCMYAAVYACNVLLGVLWSGRRYAEVYACSKLSY